MPSKKQIAKRYPTFAERQEMRADGIECPKCIFYGRDHQGPHLTKLALKQDEDAPPKHAAKKPTRKKTA